MLDFAINEYNATASTLLFGLDATKICSTTGKCLPILIFIYQKLSCINVAQDIMQYIYIEKIDCF